MMVVGVKNRAVRSRSVGSRDGRADDQVASLSDAFSGIDGFSAAEADGAGAFVFFCKSLQCFNYVTRAFSFEDVSAGIEFNAVFRSGRVEFVLDEVVSERVGYKKCLFSEGLNKITQIQ